MIVTEQNMKKMNTIDYIIYIAIGLVYAVLLSIIIDRFLDYDSINKLCDNRYLYVYQTKNNEGNDNINKNIDIDACEKARTNYEKAKFAYMIILGVLSLLGGGYLAYNNPKYMTGAYGVALGGLFTIIYFICKSWVTIGKDYKIFVLGLTFAALFYGSTRLHA